MYCTDLLVKLCLDTIPTDLEQATGVERKELEAILGGNPVSDFFFFFFLI